MRHFHGELEASRSSAAERLAEQRRQASALRTRVAQGRAAVRSLEKALLHHREELRRQDARREQHRLGEAENGLRLLRLMSPEKLSEAEEPGALGMKA